jgi:hypothetical protein
MDFNHSNLTVKRFFTFLHLQGACKILIKNIKNGAPMGYRSPYSALEEPHVSINTFEAKYKNNY